MLSEQSSFKQNSKFKYRKTISVAEEIDSPNPITIHPDELAIKALSIMNDQKINAIIAVDNQNYPVGILHIHDCLRAGLT